MQGKKVVPYKGTWIETYMTLTHYSQFMSYLIQVRGLKHEYKYDQSPRPFVVPYIGTWIETLNLHPLEDMEASYLIQVRGLKQGAAYAKTLAESRTLYRYVD